MDVENEQPGSFERIIKMEPEEEMADESGELIPCVSTVPVPSEENRAYYFPAQAVPTQESSTFPVSPRPRFTNLGAMQKWAQKRKTIEAIAQGALLSASEPMMFEETISSASTKIAVFDNKTKVEVPRQEIKDKLRINKALVALTKLNTTTDPKHYPSNKGNNYSPTKNNNSTPSGNQASRTVGLATVTHCAVTTSASNTPSMVDIYTRRNRDQAPTIIPSQAQRKKKTSILNTASVQTTSSFLTNHNTATESRPTISSSQQIAHTTPLNTRLNSPPTPAPNVRVVPYTSVRTGVSKTAVCLPNSVTLKESAAAVYVPKEIKVGSMELKLDECVNLNSICDKELTKWTAEDVAKFVRETDCSEYAEAFIDQEIDGKALTLLNQELLIQWMKLKLGPAMKLYSHILNLKHALHNAR